MQHTKLNRTLGACRFVYNKMVERVHDEGFQTRNDLCYFLTDLKETTPWLYENHSKMLQMVSTQIYGAQRSIQELKKKGYNAGSLKFAQKFRYSTFVYNQSGYHIENGFLHLSKIGSIKTVQHREIPDNASVKQVTISRQAGKWYASVTFDVDIVLPRLTTKAVGIDVGIKNFAYDSDGHATPNPLNYQRMLKPLKRVQRKISRRQKGSSNRRKAILWYQRICQKIFNRRRDFLHKLSTVYSKRYGTIFLERLEKLNMVQNHKLSQKILDSGWGTFESLLQYKANVVHVEPYNTSVECSRCGTMVPKTLGVRTHKCHVCNITLDRDHNAAINILKKGLDILKKELDVLKDNKIPQELRESTPVEIPKESVKQEEATGQVRW